MQFIFRTWNTQNSVATIAFVALISASVPTVQAQTDGTCIPISERAGRELGCFITAREILDDLPQVPLYWHLDTYQTRAAADAAKGPRGTIVESLGKIWLFTIAEAGWRPTSSERIAEIGPLPLVQANQYAAVYMEGVFKPGMASRVHRHPGAEAWYTLAGEMCVETPAGKLVQRAGGPGVIVPGGEPMELMGTGSAIRRSLVLILQDASQPRSTPATDWIPKGLCKQ